MAVRSEAEPGLFGYMFVRYLGIDVFVGAVLAILWLLNFEVRDVAGAITLVVGLFLLRSASWVAYLHHTLRPLAAWRRAQQPVDAPRLLELEHGLERLPGRMTMVLVLGWIGYFAAMPLLVWTVWPELVVIGRAELFASLLQVISVGLGSAPLYLQMTRVLVDDSLAQLDMQIDARGTSRSRPRTSLTLRLAMAGAVLFLAPTAFISSMSWLDTVHARRDQTRTELLLLVEHGVLALEAGRALPEGVELESEPPTTADGPRASGLVHREELAWAAAATADGRWLRAERPVEFPWTKFIGILLLYCVAGVSYGVSMIVGQARAVMLPVGRLNAASRRMVEVGDLRQMSRVPIVANDEIGDLTASFNQVLWTFAQLASAAETVAAGDLSIEIAGAGDLPDAFRRMINQLHGIVIQLRITALSVSAAISDIHAATREQETATERQFDEIKALDEHMRALAGSASLVDQSSGEVLEIAERSFGNTAELTAKIQSLGQHNQAIEALLEQVREISGRSDLLALNGSLEATRAGEAGRGFALVAGEMRRLAERVTGIVNDMRGLVADIHSSSVSAVLATDQARALASQTTQSARQISNEIRRQSVETGQASDATAKLANISSENSVSITQTRAIAEALHQQADHLEHALSSFTLREF